MTHYQKKLPAIFSATIPKRNNKKNDCVRRPQIPQLVLTVISLPKQIIFFALFLF
jgi:hypothetical protein